MEYQGSLLRAVATIIDTVPLFIGYCLPGYIVAVLTDSTTDGGYSLEGAPALLLLFLMFPLWVGYYSLLERTNGATPGRLALGLQAMKFDGRPADFQAALVRNLLRFVDALYSYPVAVILVETSSQKQRLGDLIATTSGVRRAEQLATQPAGPVGLESTDW